MPKNLGSISDPKDLVTKEYLENNYIQKVNIPKLILGTTIIEEETSEVPIPDTILDRENMIVYQNGLLIVEGLHYDTSTNQILLKDYSSTAGDIFTFICIS